MRRAVFLSLLSLIFLGFAVAGAAAQDRRIVTNDDADYFGFDYRTVKDVDLEGCKRACLGDSTCRAFTHNASAQWCFLKSDHGELKAAPGAVAGRVVAQAKQQAASDAPPLTFLPDDMAEQAKRFAQEVTGASPPKDGADAIMREAQAALAQNDARRAQRGYSALLALDAGNAAAWTGLARANLAISTDDYEERYSLPVKAGHAAINGYLTAGDLSARADALAEIARALQRQSLFRPALEAYKASLALKSSPALQDEFAQLRAERGFRVLDYSVDSDAASPRICVQVSESLPLGRTDFSSFVTLDGQAAPTVEAEDRQVCVEGVRHGQRYIVGLRAGLPSTVNEALEKPVTLTVYVRDRSPAARFSGNGFVLPRTGSHGLPVVTVNTSEVDVTLYRVGDRALAQAIVQDKFLSQLDRYAADELSNTLGEQLWQGTLEVERRLNEEVTTSFPVDEALTDREPGVYVMTASPVNGTGRDWEARATQWFIVSDIGLAGFSGADGVHVFARSLASAEPLQGVTVRLVARNNDVLGEAETDADGLAAFAAGLARGTGGQAPALVTARGDGVDYAFLDLTGPAFDLSDRGVGGRAAPGPIDLFTYTERGIYRPGDIVHLSMLARDRQADAISGVPLTVILTRPDGVEYRRLVAQPDAPGGYHEPIDLPENAMRGTWRAAVHADPKAAALATQQFLVEDFVPDRIEFDLTSEAKELPRTGAVSASVEGRFLYGAPAAELRLEGEVAVRAADGLAAYPGYSFGLADEVVTPTRMPLASLPATDGAGRATFDVRATNIPAASGPLEAVATVRMREGGGRAVERKLTLPVAAEGPMIGIRPRFSGAVEQGGNAAFDVIAVSAGGSRAAMPQARWQLFKITRDYQWYKVNGNWSYEPVDYSARVADGTVDITADSSAAIEAGVDWGPYRLEVEGPDGAVSSVEFSAGWYVAAKAADTPDNLSVTLDKETYRPGDTARVTFETRHAGAALVTVLGEGVVAMQAAQAGEGENTIEVPVTEDWGAGAYLTVSVYRPTSGDLARGPVRTLGLAWAGTDMSQRTLSVTFDAPEIARPRETLDLPVTINDLPTGETAYLTVAAVDVGILNVTGYEAPDASGWYFGQRRLGVEIRDLYGRLIDGSLGAAGRIRSGGDAPPATLAAAPPTEEPVALFSGVVTADDNGMAQVSFDLPAFNGTLRLMAVAWSKTAVGEGTRDVIVRDPVVVTASLPRFLAPGDQSRIRLDIDNRDGAAGDYTLSATASDELTANIAQPSLTLATEEKAVREVRLAGVSPGIGHVRVSLTAPDGTTYDRDLALLVRPAQPVVTDRRVVEIAPGASLSLTPDLVEDRVKGTGHVAVSVSRAGAIDVPSLLAALDRYPYGCAEQTVSRALPLLYLSEVARRAGLDGDTDARERVQKAIYDVMAYQSSSGGFGLWGPGDGDLWLNAYVADFLTRAREQGFSVPERAYTQLMDNVQNQLAYVTEVQGGADIAYALYVLARTRRAAVGDLRYYADTKLDDFTTPLGKAQLGAALSLYGEQDRARAAFSAATQALSAGLDADRTDYGSGLRDGAAILTLASETSAAPVAPLAGIVGAAYQGKRYTSTQEQAWLLLAAHALMQGDAALDLALDGEPVAGSLLRRYAGTALRTRPVTVVNRGDQPVDAVLTVAGVPSAPLAAGGDGFAITRTYYSFAGEPVDVATVAQNERFVVVLEVTEVNEWPSRVLVEDLLPAGFEIENPGLVDSADIAGLDWLPEKVNPARAEFRDDRFVAALDRTGGDPRSLTLAYVVRAVSPGRFAHPPARVEDMYRPYLNARTATGTMEVVAPRP